MFGIVPACKAELHAKFVAADSVMKECHREAYALAWAAIDGWIGPDYSDRQDMSTAIATDGVCSRSAHWRIRRNAAGIIVGLD